MGSLFSSLRTFYFSIKAFLGEIGESSADLDALLKRIETDPGIPVENSTQSFWLERPIFPELCDVKSEKLPESADILIIGSGITGASVAHSILHENRRHGGDARVVMLEARQLTSGATGRNGGHIKAAPYDLFSRCKERFGVERARAIVEFQMRHLEMLPALAEAEGWKEAEARKVETIDLYMHPEAWERGQKGVRELREHVPEQAKDHTVTSAEKAQELYTTSEHVLGAITYTAGAIWPYRFVTHVFKSLLTQFPSFSIETSTPVQSIATTGDLTHPFLVQTSRGAIKARHVVHATNAHVSSLVPGMRGKLIPLRAHMTAQRAGSNFAHDGSRSWSFINKRDYEYITQRPGQPDSDEGLGGELMTGGGVFHSAANGLDDIGIASDASAEYGVSSYLQGVLAVAFGPNGWGQDSPAGRIKKEWTGLVGVAADMLPFVGPIPPALTGRKLPRSSREQDNAVVPGEWISAGYTGEGMVNAWLCGQALGLMILGRDDDANTAATSARPGGKVMDWLPREYVITEKRVQRACIQELFTLI